MVHRQPYETEFAPLARETGFAVLPYRALGGGFLSGKYRTEADSEDRARGAGVRPLIAPKRLRLLDTIDAIAQEHNVRAAAIALAWLMHQPTVTAPLASATSGAQLDELLAAPAITLDDGQMARLDTAADELA